MRATRPSRSVTLACALALALALVVSACGGSSAPASTAGAGTSVAVADVSAPMGFLHVVVPSSGLDRTPYLADSADREVVLRGAAAVGLQDVAYPGSGSGPSIFPVDVSAAYDGRCPPASAKSPQPPLCEGEAGKPEYDQSTAPASGDDFAQMRALGFDLVRLVLNWSQLEPSPGRYSTAYLERVAQVVGWAGQQGISVILDMHEDQYSRFILPAASASLGGLCTPAGGTDGAPAWAVFSDGKPGCAVDGVTGLNPASSAAFYEFWHNRTVPGTRGESPGTGLQDHYIGALGALAHRFENDPTVAGYELMNEPQPGSLASLPLPNLYQASSQDLFPFYRRAIEALTGVRDGLRTCPRSAPTSLSGRCAYPALDRVHRQLIFFEPIVYRDELDFSPQVSAPFTSYRNIVYAPHVYTHTFTIDSFLGYTPSTSPYPPSYAFGYQTAEADAQAMRAAVVVTEYGAAAGSDGSVLDGETVAQEQTLVSGSTVWAWKGLSAQQATCWCVRWQYSSYATNTAGEPGSGNPDAVPSPDDVVIASRERLLDEAWPRATAGRLLAYRFYPPNGSFDMQAVDRRAVRPGDTSAETLVYVPVGDDATPVVTGSARSAGVVGLPGGSRIVLVAPTGMGDGRYQVSLGTLPAHLTDEVAGEALAPLAPIGEPVARSIAQHFLSVAASSPSATVRSRVSLVEYLEDQLLGTSDPNG